MKILHHRTINKLILIFIGVAFINTIVLSQNGFSVHMGVNSPVSDFGDRDYFEEEEALGAATGFVFGLNYSKPVSNFGLGIYLQSFFSVNGLQTHLKEEVEESFSDIDGLIPDFDITFNKYINVPTTIGVSQAFAVNNKIVLQARAGVTYNILKITDNVLEGGRYKLIVSHDAASSIGFNTGIGLLLGKGFSVNVNYFSLGSHKVGGTARDRYGSETFQDAPVKIDMISTTLGFRLLKGKHE